MHPHSRVRGHRWRAMQSPLAIMEDHGALSRPTPVILPHYGRMRRPRHPPARQECRRSKASQGADEMSSVCRFIAQAGRQAAVSQRSKASQCAYEMSSVCRFIAQAGRQVVVSQRSKASRAALRMSSICRCTPKLFGWARQHGAESQCSPLWTAAGERGVRGHVRKVARQMLRTPLAK